MLEIGTDDRTIINNLKKMVKLQYFKRFNRWEFKVLLGSTEIDKSNSCMVLETTKSEEAEEEKDFETDNITGKRLIREEDIARAKTNRDIGNIKAWVR